MQTGKLLRPGKPVYALLLSVVITMLYGQFLWNPIVFDDLYFFMVNDAGDQPVDGYRYVPFELRSLPYATLAWGKSAFGLGMLHFRIENMLLHVAVSISLFFFLAQLFDSVRGKTGQFSLQPNALAFCATLLFALHPVAVYAAGYLVQRSILMATLFSLLAMLAYLHGSSRQKPLWLWASAVFYYLAVFSKEHAIMLPAALLALTVLLHDDWMAKLRQRWSLFAVYAAIALFVIAASKGILGSAYEIYAPEMLGSTETSLNYPLSVLTQSWLFFKYAGLWLFPNPAWMSVDMREPFAPALLSSYTLAFAAFLLWGGGAAWLLIRRGQAGLLGFAMIFPWLMFMTELSTIRIQESFVLYRSYLWVVGASTIFPLLFGLLHKRMAPLVVAAMALAMFPISMDRLASFSHPLLLWDDAEKLVVEKRHLPGTYRIYYNRGIELVKAADYDRAIQDLKLAAALHPNWPFSYNNLGVAYSKKGEWRFAADAFTQSMEIANRKKMAINPKSYYGRAVAYESMGEIVKAREDYQVSCRLIKKGCEKL